MDDPAGRPRATNRNRIDYLTIAAVAALFLLPSLYPPIPPLADVPGHIGRFMVAHDIGSDPFLGQFYSYRWRPIGNLGVDIPVALLAPAIGVEPAAKWVIALIPAVMAAAVLLTYRQVHGRLAAPAFLATALTVSMPFTAGFVNYWMGIAAGWLVVWLWLRGVAPRWRLPFLLAAGAVVWSIHAMAWLLVGAILAGLEIGRTDERSGWRRIERAARRLWPFALIPVAMQLYWMAGYGAGGGNAGWFAWRDKVSALIRVMPYGDRVGSLALIATILLAAIISVSRGLSVSRGMAMAALFVGLVFLIMPHVMMDSWAADQRIAPVLMMAALIAVAPRLQSTATDIAAVMVMGVAAGIAMFTFAARSDSLTTFLSLGRSIPTHARLAYFYVQDCDPYREKSDARQHAVSLFIGRNHVFTSQWNYGGSNLMNVHYPAAGDFQDLRREMVWPARCADLVRPSLARSIADLPRAAFTHVIVDQGFIAGASPLASAGGANLYALGDSLAATEMHPQGREPARRP